MYVLTVPKIFCAHIRQSSIFSAHASHVTKCLHGRKSVCTFCALHFLHVNDDRIRSFASRIATLSAINKQQYTVNDSDIHECTHLGHDISAIKIRS